MDGRAKGRGPVLHQLCNKILSRGFLPVSHRIYPERYKDVDVSFVLISVVAGLTSRAGPAFNQLKI